MREDKKHRSENGRQALPESAPLPEMDSFERDEIEQLARSMGLRQAGAQQLISDPRKWAEWLLTVLHKRLMSLLEHQCSRSNDPLETLEKIFHSHLRFLIKNPLIPRLLRHVMKSKDSMLHNQAKQIIRQYEFDTLLILRSAKSRGMLHARVDARATAMIFVSMLQGLVLRSRIIGDNDAVLADAKVMIHGYLETLRSEPPGGAP